MIGSRECLVRQIDLVRATPAQLDDFIEHIEIDPGFPPSLLSVVSKVTR